MLVLYIERNMKEEEYIYVQPIFKSTYQFVEK